MIAGLLCGDILVVCGLYYKGLRGLEFWNQYR